MPGHEINFDGIVGPTHNYAGLAYGNVASMRHKLAVSNPKQAALQGLAKMKFMMDLGLKQAVLPPHERPHIPTLREHGFTGSDADILQKAHRENPALLAAASSASSMWAANAATVSPSADTADGRVHITPANLVHNLHRRIEAATTTRILRRIFADESQFVVHDPLGAEFGDEGAANHTRLCDEYDSPGVEIFTYGRNPTKRFPARQAFEASAAIAKQHGLDPARVVFVQQNPDAIDAGAFHNDVVAVGNQTVFLYHEGAYVKHDPDLKVRLGGMQLIEVAESGVPLAEAIDTYLFNSQIVTLADETMSLIAPAECRSNLRVEHFLRRLMGLGTPIKSVHFVDVRQSMHNGGGPACLRLRVVITPQQMQKTHAAVFLTDVLHAQLVQWVEKNYREQLTADDLRDPKLLAESRAALDELTQLLNLGAIFDFQR